MNDTVDLFAGPGGWSVAVAALGLSELGIEWDAHAVATARAAGHQRAHMDVVDADPLDWADVPLFIASPPCQAFSAAGQGLGRAAIGPFTHALDYLRGGARIEHVRTMVNAACSDPRAALVLEPMHWILQARPRKVALEQVPPVLPLWRAMAAHMRELGYSVDVDILSAEQYDVPQTRRRAILIASLDREVALPAPVRAAYRKGKEPDPSLPRWLSMADALGWGMTHRPYPVLAGARFTGGPDREKVGGSGARKAIYAERDAGRWIEHRDGDQAILTRGSANPMRTNGSEPIRLPIEGAAALQGFDRDYPWQGNASSRFRQITDAVPPPLAWHVLRAVLGLDVQEYPR